jgi:tRNA threonylcarbamoyladenosine biosynthesis protein TsaE
MESRIVLSRSDDDTASLGRELARRSQAGDIVCLFGELGSGKTVFVRGLAEGLGIDPGEVSSPTFTLIQEYRGPLPLYHVDLYRLAHHDEVRDLELEALGLDGVVAIEWSERLPQIPTCAVRVYLEDAGGSNRRVRIERPPVTSPDSSALPS